MPVPVKNRATLAQLMLSYGITICVDEDVLRAINEMTFGQLPMILDESVNVPLEYEENIIDAELVSLLEFGEDMVSSLLDMIVVVRVNAVNGTGTPWELLNTILLADNPGKVELNGSYFSIFAIDERQIVYISSSGRRRIPYTDLTYMKDISEWVNARNIMSPNYAYIYDESALNITEDVLKKRYRASIKGLSELLDRPKHWVRIDTTITEKKDGILIRDRLLDWIEPLEFTKITVRRDVDEPAIEAITGESKVNKVYALRVFREIKPGFKTYRELVERAQLPDSIVKSTLALFTRFNFLMYSFKYTPPII
ncbi:hypothetical protein [Methanopyrus kandleri]|uniref:Uncharacterized protein n=1 Tax=Methanopyrus kandleri (strain AV19 / DSM 6324 / JCM 9639 / NBRC 100938) TaxID=190192 RepID=Q8TVL6_METKA|nr:hypothetical protein [Methanopyrus kandleri]AAM02586.1 Uncharacterized protein MK1373 [Methanopyrus kandleri AV19]